MVDFFHAVHVFQLRILEEDALDERPHDRDVDVIVDRGGNQEAAVMPVVRGQVGPAAAERDPQRASRDDHLPYPDCRYSASTMDSAARASGSPAAGCRSSRISSRNSA